MKRLGVLEQASGRDFVKGVIAFFIKIAIGYVYVSSNTFTQFPENHPPAGILQWGKEKTFLSRRIQLCFVVLHCGDPVQRFGTCVSTALDSYKHLRSLARMV